jgi:protein-S-isoprenylcysteine O-methyltransferase Ste14
LEEEEMSRASVIPLLHAVSGSGSLLASLYTKTDLMAAVTFARPLGFAVFASGMLLFAVSVAYLRRAFLGDIEPVTEQLITSGPYRFVRHPLYLGMFVATTGLAIAFWSLWGLLIVLAIFVPAGLWRARLEEQALARRFGRQWQEYVRSTHFMVPLIL